MAKRLTNRQKNSQKDKQTENRQKSYIHEVLQTERLETVVDKNCICMRSFSISLLRQANNIKKKGGRESAP